VAPSRAAPKPPSVLASKVASILEPMPASDPAPELPLRFESEEADKSYGSQLRG